MRGGTEMRYSFASRLAAALVIALALLMMASCDTGGNPEPQLYTVTFWNNGVYASMTVMEGHSVRRPVDPVSDSRMLFDGWRVYGTDTCYDFSLPVTSDLTLEATWSSVATISFDDLFGSVETVTVKYGDGCPLPRTPQREGYVFLGWYKDDGSAFSSAEPVTSDMTVYAKWGAGGAQAGDGHIPEEWFEISSDNRWSVDIIGYSGLMPEGMKESMTTLYVPSTINGMPVRSVSSLGTSNLVSVTIEDGVQVLDNAFCGSPRLKYVDLPDSLVDIGSSFTDCTGLETISLPSEISSIPYQAFMGCTALEGIQLPQHVSRIGQEAFAYCGSLTALTIPDTVVEIGASAFLGTGLETISLENVNMVGSDAFRDCASLTSVTFGTSPLTLGSAAFRSCSSLDTISIPYVKTIEDETFAYCTALESVDFGKYVTQISSGAFLACTSLSEIVIPDHEVIIEPDAFSGCTSVRRIDTGASLASTDNLPVGSALEDLVLGATVADLPETLAGLPSLKSVVIEGPVTNIEDEAFLDCASLEELVLSEHIAYIGNNAFEGCAELQSINLEKVKEIGSMAFKGCTSLDSVILGDGLNYIGSEAFAGTALTQVKVPASVEYFSPSAFAGCASLKSATISSASIGESAFSDCSALETVSLQQGVKTIGDYAFQDCTNLKGMEFPSSVESVGAAAFMGCASLTNVAFTQDSHVAAVGNEAFRDCIMLESVEIPSSVRTLGEEIFRDCQSLVAIDLPSGLTSIGGGAFAGCSSLKELVIPDSVTSLEVGYGVEVGFLESCSSLEKVVFSDNAESLVQRFDDRSQMEGCTALKYIDTGGLTNVHCLAWPESLETIIIESSQASCAVPAQAFADKPNLVHLAIGPGVACDWENAFDGTGNIEVLELESMLGDYSWNGPAMGSVRQMSVCGELEEITYEMLEGACSLEGIHIGDAVSVIGENAFKDCTSLASITIPGSVREIGEGAFSGLERLGNVTIGEGVAAIEPEAFKDCTALSSITIPASVTGLGYNVFSGCSALSQVVFAQASPITFIPSGAFENCTALASITIPDGVTVINTSAFAGSGVKEIMIDGDVERIGARAFENCSSLEKVEIGPSLQSIQAEAFEGCTQLQTLVLDGLTALPEGFEDLPFEHIGTLVVRDSLPEGLGECLAYEDFDVDIVLESVSEIPDGAFSGVQGLGAVKILGNVESFGTGVFKGSGLKSFIYENSGDFIVPEESFQGCAQLATVEIGNTYRVGKNAFKDCAAMTDFTVDENASITVCEYGFSGCSSLSSLRCEALDASLPVAYASNYAFQGCTSLEEVRISYACPYSFSGCTALRTVIFDSSITGDTMICSEHSFDGCTVTVLEIDDIGKLGSYMDGGKGLPLSDLEELRVGPFDRYSIKEALSSLDNTFTLVLLDGWTTLSTSLFQGLDCIGEIVFPSTLESIEGSVFSSCGTLTRVEIPGNVKSLDGGVFEDCVNLSAVVLEEGVESLSDGVFAGCTSIEEIVIPASVSVLGIDDLSSDYTGVFAGCTGLSGITFASGSTLRQIGTRSFSGCQELIEINLPEGLEVIEDWAFQDTGITEVDIPASVRELHGFAGSDSLVAVNIPEDSELEEFSFADCIRLRTVRLPASVEKIPSGAFINCNELEKVNIPDAVTLVDNFAFRGVTSLDEIEVGHGGFDGDGLLGLEVGTIRMVDSKDFKGKLPGARRIEISGCIPPNLKTLLNRCSAASVVIEEGVTEIPDGVFTELENYSSTFDPVSIVVIPESVTAMGENAFSDFTGTIQLMCGYLPEEWGSEWYGNAHLIDADGVTINTMT